MAKVKIKTQTGVVYVEKIGLITSKPILGHKKDDKGNDQWWIQLQYIGDKDGKVIGAFESELACENIIINDL